MPEGMFCAFDIQKMRISVAVNATAMAISLRMPGFSPIIADIIADTTIVPPVTKGYCTDAST